MLTKAQERAKTMCRAVGDEDPRRRWGGARGAGDGERLQLLDSEDRRGANLWECCGGQEGLEKHRWRGIETAALLTRVEVRRDSGTAGIKAERGGSGELHGVEAKALCGSGGIGVQRSGVASATQTSAPASRLRGGCSSAWGCEGWRVRRKRKAGAFKGEVPRISERVMAGSRQRSRL